MKIKDAKTGRYRQTVSPDIYPVGTVFGRWTLTALIFRRNKHWHAPVKCECGKPYEVRIDHLRSGRSTQCRPCATSESHKKHNGLLSTHNMTGTPEYRVWISIKGRCKYPSCKAYKNYGGRGIKICKRWDESFEAFYEDMGLRPEGTSIDRINNYKGYEPGNCRWASSRVQGRNRRYVRKLTFNGRTERLDDWAEEIGLTRSTLEQRIAKGWSVEKALTTPLDKSKSHKRKRYQHYPEVA